MQKYKHFAAVYVQYVVNQVERPNPVSQQFHLSEFSADRKLLVRSPLYNLLLASHLPKPHKSLASQLII